MNCFFFIIFPITQEWCIVEQKGLKFSPPLPNPSWEPIFYEAKFQYKNFLSSQPPLLTLQQMQIQNIVDKLFFLYNVSQNSRTVYCRATSRPKARDGQRYPCPALECCDGCYSMSRAAALEAGRDKNLMNTGAICTSSHLSVNWLLSNELQSLYKCFPQLKNTWYSILDLCFALSPLYTAHKGKLYRKHTVHVVLPSNNSDNFCIQKIPCLSSFIGQCTQQRMMSDRTYERNSICPPPILLSICTPNIRLEVFYLTPCLPIPSQAVL